MIARITEACIAAPMPWRKRAADEHRGGRGGAAEQRGEREQRHAQQEHALAADQVAEPAGQQQEAAEGDEECVDDPGEVALGEVEVVLDRRQGNVHDRGVEHDHQLCEAYDHEREPAASF